MMIQPTGTPPPRLALVRHQHAPEPLAETEQPKETSQLSGNRLGQRVLSQPQRSSAEIPQWRQSYESKLGLTPRALGSRSQALKSGGPEMLYRMYPLLFQQDLHGPYQNLAQLLPEKAPQVALAGDCHLGNFGTLRSENRDLVWSLNDYDQIGKGGAESDLCRAGASLLLLCQQHGWKREVAADLISALTRQYSKQVSAYCQAPPRSPLGISKDDAQDPVRSLIKKAERHTQEELLAKWTEPSDQGPKFKRDDDLHQLDDSQQTRLQGLLEEIRLPATVQILDRCCRWEAGGSSLGLERYYLLVKKDGESLPTLLELKQVLPCALATSDPDPKNCDPQLLQDGFRWLKAPKDNWQRVVRADNGVYLLRERQRARDTLKTEKLDGDEAVKLAKQMGTVLAQAHAHGGSGSASELSKWIDGREDLLSSNLLNFSSSYAAQVEQDYQALGL